MGNSFEGKTEILLEWGAIGFLGHFLAVPFDNPFRLFFLLFRVKSTRGTQCK